MEGDSNQESDAPYFINISYNQLASGVRTGWANYSIGSDLTSVSPNAWHHVAASFRVSTRTLTLYLDGVQVAQGTLAARTATGSPAAASPGEP